MSANYGLVAGLDPMGTIADSYRQAQKDAQATADWELAHKAKQQAWDDNQNLRALATQLQEGKQVPQEVQTGTIANMGPPVPPQSLRDLSPTIQESFRERRGGPSALRDVANPAYDAAMKAYGEQVKSAPATAPVTETQMKTVPYSTGEKSQKLAEQLLKQGDIKGALAAATDVLKLDEAMPEHLNKMSEAINKKGGVLMAMGLPPDQVAKRLSEEYAQAGDTTSAQLAANTNFLPNGVTTVTLPNGGQIVHEYTPEGKMEHKYTPPVKPTIEKAYGNPREVMFGGEKVKEHPIFEGPHAMQNKEAWVKAGSDFNKLGDFNGYAKKDNENTQKIQINGGLGPESSRHAIGLPAGYVEITRGPRMGMVVKMDFDENGKPISRAVTQAERAQLGDLANNYKWDMDMPREKQVAMITAVRPRIQKLAEQFKDLNNTDIKAANKALNYLKDEFGWQETAAFNSNAKTAVLELTRALAGTGAMSDSRVQMELSNLDKSASPAQFESNIKNVMGALDSYEKAFKKRGNPSPAGTAKSLKGTVVGGWVFNGNSAAEWNDKSKWSKQ